MAKSYSLCVLCLMLCACAGFNNGFGPGESQAYDEVPPLEYIVDAPLYYDDHPGGVFYPLYIDAPGTCYCVMPMHYFEGAWYGVGGREIYRGRFEFHRPPPPLLAQWRATGGVFDGRNPVVGSWVWSNGRMRSAPPVNSIHGVVPPFNMNDNRFINRQNNGFIHNDERPRPHLGDGRQPLGGKNPSTTGLPPNANLQGPNPRQEIPRALPEQRREPPPQPQRDTKPQPDKNKDCRRPNC